MYWMVPPTGGQTDHGDEGAHGAGGEWEYPPVVAELEAAGLNPIMEYIRRRKENIVEKVSCQTIYELCVEAERSPGTRRRMRWWDQNGEN